MTYLEPYLDERLQDAKSKANSILASRCDTPEELHAFLTAFLSKHFNRPFFDPYWESLTIDQLYFEFILVTGQFKPASEVTSDLLKENAKEVAGMFDDWGPPKTALTPEMQNIADKFMKTGEWKK